MSVDFKVSNQRVIACVGAVALIAALSGCSSWTTRYSGVYREADDIRIAIYKEGPYRIGYCGVCRTTEQSYQLSLKPIKREYRDDEIELSQDAAERTDPPIARAVRLRVKGAVSFDADYSHFTLNVMIDADGKLTRFPGNGRYAVRSGE